MWHKACVMIFLYLMTVDLKVTGVDWVVGGFLAAILPTRHIQHHLVNNILGNTWFWEPDGTRFDSACLLTSFLVSSNFSGMLQGAEVMDMPSTAPGVW